MLVLDPALTVHRALALLFRTDPPVHALLSPALLTLAAGVALYAAPTTKIFLGFAPLALAILPFPDVLQKVVSVQILKQTCFAAP
jgi:hypothetical protein